MCIIYIPGLLRCFLLLTTELKSAVAALIASVLLSVVRWHAVVISSYSFCDARCIFTPCFAATLLLAYRFFLCYLTCLVQNCG